MNKKLVKGAPGLGDAVAMAGNFVISLDFELLWGVRDHATKDTYGANVLGVRQAIPAILDLFEERCIRATWATVGMVFFENKEEMIAALPNERPTYGEERLSNYSYLSELGSDERTDPYYFGGSLVREIRSRRGQEIASHSFSHFYCLEQGQTLDQFAADVDAAIAAARLRDIDLKSFVFPRNQYAARYLEVLADRNFKTFRGNERSWAYEAMDGSGQTRARRAVRLLDNYLNLTGHHCYCPASSSGLIEVPASRFLRPYHRRMASADCLRLKRIKDAMSFASSNDLTFHLWWHPHNFGANLPQNLSFLASILDHFRRLREEAGMRSANMGDFA